jgi:carbonic anhydrase/acetyltransferase-like protein (isoleucine patch superfamily)
MCLWSQRHSSRCTVHDNVLIGMGAIVMDNCIVQNNSIVAAGR